jgi:hypothetical protein
MDMIKNVDSKTYLLCCILALLSSLPSDNYAQSIKRQVISSYGSSGMSDHVFIGQTAGQSFNTTMSINGVTVSQGFQQPVTIALEEIEDQVYTDLNVLVYPNPATRSITISSKEEIPSSFIQVTDINGKYLLTEKVQNLYRHQIDCALWASGVYFITIFDAHQNNKTLRLIISK